MARGRQPTADLLNEKVADFLQQDDDTPRFAVVSGVTPRETDNVHQRRQMMRDVLKLNQFDLVEHLPERLQVQTDVLCLVQCCSSSHDNENTC